MVGDGGNAALLQSLLETRNIQLTARIERREISSSALSRHTSYLRLAAHAVVNRDKFDAIFFWQQYVGYYYVVLAILTLCRPLPTAVYFIITNAKRGGWHRSLFNRVALAIVNSKHIKKAIFIAEADLLYSDVPEAKRVLLPVYVQHSNYMDTIRDQKTPAVDFFSGGTSNRDYAALKAMASKLPERKFAVACLQSDFDRVRGFPPNVSVHLAGC